MIPPRCTYRVQLRLGFGFADAARMVPRLAAVPETTRGYDVIDHTRVSEELGGEDACRDLVALLARE